MEGRRWATDIEIHAREILWIEGSLNEILVKHTGQNGVRLSW